MNNNIFKLLLLFIFLFVVTIPVRVLAQSGDIDLSGGLETNHQNYFYKDPNKAFLQAGIDFNQRLDGEEPQPDANISETLFFFPMVGTIQELIKELAPVKAP